MAERLRAINPESVKLKMQECPHCRKPLVVAEVMTREAKIESMVREFIDAVASDPNMKTKFGKYFEAE